MVKFLNIQDYHAINAAQVKFMHVSDAKKEGSEGKFWVCFVFANDLTCYAEYVTEEEAKTAYNDFMSVLAE
jgi:hypothetical protein